MMQMLLKIPVESISPLMDLFKNLGSHHFLMISVGTKSASYLNEHGLQGLADLLRMTSILASLVPEVSDAGFDSCYLRYMKHQSIKKRGNSNENK